MTTNKRDRSLGMHRDITRRDFMNGVALATGTLSLPMSALAAAADASEDYPPSRMGMRGSHAGSFEAAHQLRDRKSIDVSGARRLAETYDLLVVGGGISGLAAAHYFIKSVGKGVKVLILDAQDSVAIQNSVAAAVKS